MKRIAKIAAVGAAGLGLVVGAIPAQAATTGALAFDGSASVTPGLGYPVLGADGDGNAWNFRIVTGVGVAVDDATTPPTPAFGDAVGSVDNGTLRSGAVVPGAFCGASGGTGGSGAISIGGSNLALSNVGWLQSVASLIVFSNNDGNVPGATVIGVVSAIPPGIIGGTGSCSAGTAQDFRIVGAGVALGA